MFISFASGNAARHFRDLYVLLPEPLPDESVRKTAGCVFCDTVKQNSIFAARFRRLYHTLCSNMYAKYTKYNTLCLRAFAKCIQSHVFRASILAMCRHSNTLAAYILGSVVFFTMFAAAANTTAIPANTKRYNGVLPVTSGFIVFTSGWGLFWGLFLRMLGVGIVFGLFLLPGGCFGDRLLPDLLPGHFRLLPGKKHSLWISNPKSPGYLNVNQQSKPDEQLDP